MSETTAIDRVAASVSEVQAFDPGLGAYNFSNLGDAVRFSDLMARAGEMLPDHLRGKAALCLAVTMRAVQWKFDPFALAAETYQAKQGGMIGYQAKVFVAALKNCTGIRLRFRYEGEVRYLDKPATSARGNQIAARTATGNLKCIAYAEVDGEMLEYETPTLDQIAIKNSPGWHNTPHDQITYFAGRGWVRRYEPGVMMGAYSEDEVRSMESLRDVTPAEDRQKSKPSFGQMAIQARKDAADPTDDQSEQEEAAVEEDQTETASPAISTPDVAGLNPMQAEAKWLGVTDFRSGAGRDQCPFPEEEPLREFWLAGWDHANGVAG